MTSKNQQDRRDQPNPANENRQIADFLWQHIEKGNLVRLFLVKGKGVTFSLPCRILHFDQEKELLSVYHVDEKKVYNVSLNEIEDFHTHQ